MIASATLLFYKNATFPEKIDYENIKVEDYFEVLNSTIPLIELEDRPYRMYQFCKDGIFNPKHPNKRLTPRHGDLIRVTSPEGEHFYQMIVDPDLVSLEDIKRYEGEIEAGEKLALLYLNPITMN
jgi:hypothetical protein